jgi:hypothetical protein
MLGVPAAGLIGAETDHSTTLKGDTNIEVFEGGWVGGGRGWRWGVCMEVGRVRAHESGHVLLRGAASVKGVAAAVAT